MKNIKKKGNQSGTNLYSEQTNSSPNIGPYTGNINSQFNHGVDARLQERERQLSEYQQDGGAGYDFNQANNEENSRVRDKKQKDQMKYNLFSMADEQANTKCKMGLCTPNEICASEPKKNKWKE